MNCSFFTFSCFFFFFDDDSTKEEEEEDKKQNVNDKTYSIRSDDGLSTFGRCIQVPRLMCSTLDFIDDREFCDCVDDVNVFSL